MSQSGPRFTYADYKLLPEDVRCEVLDGELLMTPAPTASHQRILGRLYLRLGNHVAAGGLGELLPAPTDVILSEENVVQPDILFVGKDRLGIIDPAGGVNGAPDLVIEILSPSTAGRDKVLKRKLYAVFGVREYWVVDPAARSIELMLYAPTGMETWRVFPPDLFSAEGRLGDSTFRDDPPGAGR